MKNIKYLIGIIIGMTIMYGISNAYRLNASEVTYDNKNTTLESDTVSGAVNELGVLATTKLLEIEEKINNLSNEVSSTKTSIDNLNDSLENIKIRTLWTNSEWTGESNLSAFAPQTIKINSISNYDIIGICHSVYDKTIYEFNFIINIANKTQILDKTWSADVSGYYFRAYHRKFTIIENGISFQDGYSVNHDIRQKDNSYAIPVKIIGIKL